MDPDPLTATRADAGQPAAAPERRIGPYELLAELGRGGMGVVYLASRADEQYRKQVALKLIKAGADRDEVVLRFRRERQILAGLEHPNIARLLDGGTTPEGLPYFVMEYVEGRRIDAYCQDHGLQTLERLQLFRGVCSAIEYAHRNLIVHRDLKPGNVLVTREGVPKLLDFGIAKLVGPGPAAETATATGLAMTPAYASPEQVRGEAVTTASDVYSLGVVLYELLTGQLPYRLEASSPLALMRAVCEEEPEKPSTAVGRTLVLERTVTALAEGAPRRGETPKRLRSRLKGDLDTIVLKALRKEPSQRYSSVEALSEDLRRYCEGLPIGARNPTLAYRTRKFVRRHWAGVASGVLAATLLALFVASHLAQAARIRKERDKAAQVAAFLEDLFKVSDPGEARGNSITAREILDVGAERIRGGLRQDPEVRASLLDTIGNVYKRLGLYGRAEALLREALASRRQLLGEHPDVASSLHGLATVLYYEGRYEESEALFREALAMRRKLLGDEHPDVAKTLNNLANVAWERGDFDAAESLYREGLALRRRLFGPDDPEVASSLHNLAIVLTDKGDYPQAEAIYRETLAIERKRLGEQHPDVVRSLHNLAVVLQAEGRLAEAEQLYQEALAGRRRVLGDRHPEVADSLAALAAVRIEKEEPGAEPLVREALGIAEQAYGPRHVVVAGLLVNLGDAQRLAGKRADAEAAYRRSLAMYRELFPAGHPNTSDPLTQLGELLVATGRAAEAEPLLREAVTVRRGALPRTHPALAESESLLGACLAAQARYADAESLLLESYPRIRAARGAGSKATRDALGRLVDLYRSWGRPDQADRYAVLLAASASAGPAAPGRSPPPDR